LRLRDTDGDKIEFRLAPDGKLQEFVNDRLELPEVHYLRYRGTTGVVQDSTGDFKLRKANRNQKARILQVLAEFAGVPCSFGKIRPVCELKFVDCDQDVLLFRRSSKAGKLQQYINGALEPKEIGEIAYNLEEGMITTRNGYFYIKPEERFEKAWLLRHFCYQAKVDWCGDEPLLWTTRPSSCSLEGPSTDTDDEEACGHDSGNQLKQSEDSTIAKRKPTIASLTGVVRPGSETLPKRRQRQQAREQLERNRLMKANEPEKFNDSDAEFEFDSQVEIERQEAANRRYKEQCAWIENSQDEADQLENDISKPIQEKMPPFCDGNQLSSDTDGNQLSSDSDSQLEIERLEAANSRFKEEFAWLETSDEEADFNNFAKENTQACQGSSLLRWLVVDEHGSEGQAGNSSWQSVQSGDGVVVEAEAVALEMHESFSSSDGENVASESTRTPHEDDANADHQDRCISNSQDLDDDILQRLCEEGAIDESILHSPAGILPAPASQDTVPPNEDELLAEGSEAVSSHMDESHGEEGAWELLTNEEDLPSTTEPATQWFLLCSQEEVELPADDAASFACSFETRSIHDADWHWEAPGDTECYILSEAEDDDDDCTHEVCSSLDQRVGRDVESPHSCGMHDSACQVQVRQAPRLCRGLATYMTSQTLQRNSRRETGLETIPCTTLSSF
jgi:hypothetical protein